MIGNMVDHMLGNMADNIVSIQYGYSMDVINGNSRVVKWGRVGQYCLIYVLRLFPEI